MFRALLLALIAICVSAGTYTPEAEADRVISLPGAAAINADFGFSGYLAINGSQGLSKMQHYWLVESLNNAASAPVAFWTNG